MAKREVLKAIKSCLKIKDQAYLMQEITDKVFRDIRALFESGNEGKN